MSIPKLEFNLDEENELSFKISIEGSASDIESTDPKMRFVISEVATDKGWIFPALQGDDGFVNVKIPPGEDVFSETVEYTGRLEVILGNHYFVPTEVDIEFKKPLKVEALVVRRKPKPIIKERQEHASASEQPYVQSSLIQTRRRKKPKKRTWEDLSLQEQTRVKKLFLKKKLVEAKQKKAAIDARRKKKEKSFKDHLKNIMSDSLLDD